jgi:Zn finger protein HypA/HybF involved in hydrogenase expression|tara:strand:- start:46 stop:249 length:204 start_codon:yes stop_codon:yes gene_type:complete
MIIEAKKLDSGIMVNKYEINLECSNCGMTVDAEEYKSGTCSDCGATWNGKQHTKIHVTSIPLAGKVS